MPGVCASKFARIVRKSSASDSNLMRSQTRANSASPDRSFATACSRVQSRPVASASRARWSGQKHPGAVGDQTRRVSSSTMKKSGFSSLSVRQVRAM